MKKTFFLLFLLINIQSFGCPNFLFHLTFSGYRTFTIQNMNNPSNFITVSGNGSIDAWSFSSTLGSPCGVTFGSNICYTILEVTAHVTSDEIIAIRFNGPSPNHLTIHYDYVNRTFSVTNPGNPAAYSLSWGSVADNPPSCCDDPLNCCTPDIIISGSYATPLTQSGSWIQSNGFTIIPVNAIVKLDADPVIGFVLFHPGFSTLAGATLVAQALDGCGILIPH